jgi:TPR repeat protein
VVLGLHEGADGLDGPAAQLARVAVGGAAPALLHIAQGERRVAGDAGGNSGSSIVIGGDSISGQVFAGLGITSLAAYYRDIEKNYDEMKKLYQKGADLGDTLSMYLLAKFSQRFDKNYELAENMYQKASNLDHILSTFMLGILYQEQNKDDLMVKCFITCMKVGYSPAVAQLIKYYTTKNKEDLAEKIAIYHIKTKTPAAYMLLGNYYSNCKKNTAKMHKYYIKAFNADDYKCPFENNILPTKKIIMFNLGRYYCENAKDYKASERCYLYAFDNKHTKAAYQLGYLYQNHIQDLLLFLQLYPY